MGKKAVETASPVIYEQPQELRISLPPDSKLKGEIKGIVSGPGKIIATGRITGYSMDKHGCSLTMELKSLDVDSGMGGDIKHLKSERSVEKKDDQY